MAKYTSLLILIYMFCACSTTKTKLHPEPNAFVKFNYDHVNSMNADGEVIPDKPFTIELPIKLKKRTDIVSGDFTHVFAYEHDEKIVLIYDPGYHAVTDKIKQFINISYQEFVDLAEKKGIDWSLRDIKLLKNRRFELKIIEDHYYALYLNIKKRDTAIYHYSINSLRSK